MKVLVTGAAGFIGFHVARRLLERGDDVVGIDNLNDYYDVNLKMRRLKELDKFGGVKWQFIKLDLVDRVKTRQVFGCAKYDRIIHLAAQAGVRHSLSHPQDYIDSNITGFLNVLEACRAEKSPHLTYASTSSVYGANTALPFTEDSGADHPLQLYAATKRANELMAHSYSHLFGLPTTGLRFFTVYGPWGRPDMAMSIFTKAILEGQPVLAFNEGNHRRDFTYVGDIAEGVIRASDQIATPNEIWSGDAPDPATSNAPFRLFNIGNSQPITVIRYIREIERCLGRTADIRLLPLQPEDVPDTAADCARLHRAVGFQPATDIAYGVEQFVQWYLGYHERVEPYARSLVSVS